MPNKQQYAAIARKSEHRRKVLESYHHAILALIEANNSGDDSRICGAVVALRNLAISVKVRNLVS